VRWDNLTATGGGHADPDPAGPARALPLALAAPSAGPLAGAVARTFDTPEFQGMTFHEIRAKSIINRVPAASRVPFEWTVNPYRGCSHACVYCLAGDTRILMADGGTKRLSAIRTGDRLVGTSGVGRHRRYATARVLAHWSTMKPAYRVVLADGTTLIASGEHRFLTDRGWKHVTGTAHGSQRRAHLTLANRMAGPGGFAPAPDDTRDYRLGYLSGFVHADGHAGGGHPAGLARARRFALDAGCLAALGAAPREFAGASVRAESTVLAWPARPSRDWRKGLLAGVYDASAGDPGGPDDLAVRDATAPVFRVLDKVLLDWLVESLEVLGFATTTTIAPSQVSARHANAATGGGSVWPDLTADSSGAPHTVRVLGGLRERVRFAQTVAPVAPAGQIVGAAVRTDDSLRVVSVEPLGMRLPMFDITTSTGDFIAAGVVSHNCFARNTHTYLDLDAGHDFDRQIVVKVNAGEVLRRELSAPRWRGAPIAMGTNVDCYQRAEGRYRLMPEIIAALRDHANPFSILTKGTLIARDLDLLRQASSVTSVGVSLSIGFLDETLWRSVEPGTPSPRRRVDVVRRFADAGFRVGILLAPVLPGLTDTAESIEQTVTALAAAGAASVYPIALHLRPGAKQWYAAWLGREHPELLPRYRELFGDRAYLPKSYQDELSARVRLAARRHSIGAGSADRYRATTPSSAAPPDKPPACEQLTLL
jgi:DNA repair photolyase